MHHIKAKYSLVNVKYYDYDSAFTMKFYPTNGILNNSGAKELTIGINNIVGQFKKEYTKTDNFACRFTFRFVFHKII